MSFCGATLDLDEATEFPTPSTHSQAVQGNLSWASGQKLQRLMGSERRPGAGTTGQSNKWMETTLSAGILKKTEILRNAENRNGHRVAEDAFHTTVPPKSHTTVQW